MNEWLTAQVSEPAVLVTVAIVEGSGPREPGAKMLVTARGQHDTIGGGHLEMCAIEVARGMLKGGGGTRLERYALGPTLGQCCGGVVHLAFELVTPALAEVLAGLRARRREDSWRLSAIDGQAASLLLGGEDAAAAPAFDRALGTHVVRDESGRRWLVDACLAPRAHLVLFGAGHVGAAIVRMLGELPCSVTWVDEREDMFPASLPANITAEATDTPEACVVNAPKKASYLVMTHSHALDQRITEAILARDDVGWFGLIGSDTKRVQFERRMAARGLPQERIDKMICPIGLPGITSKLPAAIAASVCAQLLMAWEA